MQKVDFHDNLLLAYTEREDGNMDPQFGKKKKVQENREKVFEALDINGRYVVEGQQIHDDFILPLYPENIKMWKGDVVTGVDGFITREDHINILMRLADCVPVVLYDPEHAAVGVFHIGWRGAVKNLHVSGMERMVKRFKSEPTELLAWIGPSAGDQYRSQDRPEQMDDEAWKEYISTTKKGYKVNLVDYVKYSLKDAGMYIKNMTFDSTTTIDNDKLYSHQDYQANKGPQGRFLLVVSINQKKKKPKKDDE